MNDNVAFARMMHHRARKFSAVTYRMLELNRIVPHVLTGTRVPELAHLPKIAAIRSSCADSVLLASLAGMQRGTRAASAHCPLRSARATGHMQLANMVKHTRAHTTLTDSLFIQDLRVPSRPRFDGLCWAASRPSMLVRGQYTFQAGNLLRALGDDLLVLQAVGVQALHRGSEFFIFRVLRGQLLFHLTDSPLLELDVGP